MYIFYLEKLKIKKYKKKN